MKVEVEVEVEVAKVKAKVICGGSYYRFVVVLATDNKCSPQRLKKASN